MNKRKVAKKKTKGRDKRNPNFIVRFIDRQGKPNINLRDRMDWKIQKMAIEEDRSISRREIIQSLVEKWVKE